MKNDSSITVSQNEIKHDEDSKNTDFPVEAFPKTVRRFIREASDSIVCPPELVALPLLVMFGSAIGNSRVIQLKRGWTEGPTLYAACIARPGEKKSPAANAATKPLRKVQSRLRRQYQQEREEYERVSSVNSGDDSKEVPKEPVMERTYVDDTTVEALSVVLRDNQRGVMVDKDELSAWVKAMNQYKQGKGSDRQFWLSVWSNRYVAVDRKGQQAAIMLDRPFAGVYGGIQPDVLHELKANREDGLLDRFLFAYPDPVSSRWSDTEISEQTEEDVHRLYVALRKLPMEVDDYGDPAPTSVCFSEDAKQVFIELVNSHREEMEAVRFPERLRGPWSKLEGYLARITLIMSLLRSVSENLPERIETHDVVAASLMLCYFKAQTRKVYGAMYAEDRLDLLAVDVASYVEAMGGYVKASPANIFYSIRSEHKPSRENELTKELKKIAERTPALDLENGSSNGKRWVSLTLKDVDPVDTFDPAGPPLTETEHRQGSELREAS